MYINPTSNLYINVFNRTLDTVEYRPILSVLILRVFLVYLLGVDFPDVYDARVYDFWLVHLLISIVLMCVVLGSLNKIKGVEGYFHTIGIATIIVCCELLLYRFLSFG